MRPWTRGKKTAKNPWPLHCQLLLPLVEEKTEDGVSAAGCGGAPCADVVLQQGEVRHQCVVEEAGRGANGGGNASPAQAVAQRPLGTAAAGTAGPAAGGGTGGPPAGARRC